MKALAIAVLPALFLLGACEGHDNRSKPAEAANRHGASIPSEERRIDLASWAERSRSELAREHPQLESGEMPTLSSIGICSKMSVAFSAEGGAEAKPEVLVCDLDQAYDPAAACDALGLRIAAASSTEGAWQALTPADDRLLTVRCNRVDGGCTQILVQFRR